VSSFSLWERVVGVRTPESDSYFCSGEIGRRLSTAVWGGTTLRSRFEAGRRRLSGKERGKAVDPVGGSRGRRGEARRGESERESSGRACRGGEGGVEFLKSWSGGVGGREGRGKEIGDESARDGAKNKRKKRGPFVGDAREEKRGAEGNGDEARGTSRSIRELTPYQSKVAESRGSGGNCIETSGSRVIAYLSDGCDRTEGESLVDLSICVVICPGRGAREIREGTIRVRHSIIERRGG